MSTGAEDARKTCFVVMGFGKKTDFESGRTLDLDNSYRNMIKPAIEEAGLVCIRADEIVHSGMIDVPMYEQLLKADVVVADLSTSNNNAYYELGVRHALRPYTTVVIAEDGIKKFPFDVSHVVVRQYHHLGEDIGIGEGKRFRTLLTDAVKTIMAENPRRKDSPVYALLQRLNPPDFAAVMEATAKDLASESEGAQAASPRGPASAETHGALMQQVDEAQKRKDFLTAKTILTVVRGMMNQKTPERPEERREDPYIIQRLALLTYKSKFPTERAALEESRGLLATLGPETSNDTETLGLWGAVHKRLWELLRQDDPAKAAEYLDESVRAYERGFYLRNDYYNGINFAYLLSVRAAHAAAEPADAVADFVQARRVRKEVLGICDQWLKDNPPPDAVKVGAKGVEEYRNGTYWVLATRAEALIGLGDAAGEQQLQDAYAAAPQAWMKDSTEEQLQKLRPLLADSPLNKYLMNSDSRSR